METFETIERLREKNDFVFGNYEKYRNNLKVERKQTKSNDLKLLYKLEINLAKYLTFDSRKFLKKNMRLLKNKSGDFYNLYRDLMNTMLIQDVEGSVNVNDLIDLRGKFVNYNSFLDGIDILLEKSNADFDLSSLRVKYKWHDIDIHFDTSQEKDAFLNGTFKVKSKKYDSMIAEFIKKLKRKKKQLLTLIKKSPERVRCIYEKLKKLILVTEELKSFLQDNLVESKYIESFLKDTKALEIIYKSLNDIRCCRNIENSRPIIEVPEVFKEVEEEIKESEKKTKVSKRHAIKYFMSYLDKELSPKQSSIELPFIPVIYDVAYDYINYPNENKKLTELFKRLNIFK